MPHTLKKGLYTQIVGSRILHFKELDSTMDRAAEEAERGTPDGTVILCDQQTRGRGRFNRVWVSPAGNLILSVVLRPTLEALPFVSVLSGLAVARAIEMETTLDPVIKWPNDVLVRGRKICGLLVENSLQGRNVRHSIVGIGLNVELDPGDSPEIAQTATSLRLETGRATDLSALLLRLLHELDELYVALRNGQLPRPQVEQLSGDNRQARPGAMGRRCRYRHGKRRGRHGPPAAPPRQRRPADPHSRRSNPQNPRDVNPAPRAHPPFPRRRESKTRL